MRLSITSIMFLLLGAVALGGGCATVVPIELANARTAYMRASMGPAAQLAPAEVHKAKAALDQAEQAFGDEPTAQRTRDLAYVAERKAQLAEALAASAGDEKRKAQAQVELQATQSQKMQETKGELSSARRDLAASERGRAGEAQARVTADQGRVAAEAKAAAADERARLSAKALADFASVKQEPRGMVITLSGSILFATDRATLLPAAQDRLNQVAEALLSIRERAVLVEGHTDSRGSASHNLDLSQRRADAVRTFLVSRGYMADRIQARGIGKARPVSENDTADGRANNRRVEIIVEPDAHSSR
ncbi:MAG TPA: OmpA family protein [Polyangia bacterium]|jgi:outer membrane protein OmpA-like peptidoglycan-associated protein